MNEKTIRKYIGKKCLIILKNNFKYTTIIPTYEGSCFTITDKFGMEFEVDCDFINFISEVKW